MNEGYPGYSVTELNRIVSGVLHRDPRLQNVVVFGEVSGFKHHIASGHWYFTLKDEQAAVSCVMFRSNTIRSGILPRDGMSVVLTGYVDIFPKTGQYQMYVSGMKPAGLGELYLRFEALKQKLDAEGLFHPSRKRALPMVPRKVAVVTSQSGAALRDILNVSRHRSPWIPIVLIPVAVQGEGAAAEIAAGIRKAGSLLKQPDVILVGRGGGSAEDLWCFNEEAVVRAVAESPVPVVSGVGHEIDTTLCDLAADVRASTPSNAAEIVFPDRLELAGRIHALRANLQKALDRRSAAEKLQISRIREKLILASPESRIRKLILRRQTLKAALSQAVLRQWNLAETSRQVLDSALSAAFRKRLAGEEARLQQTRMLLESVSPLKVLARGYALVCSPEGKVVASAEQAEQQERMILRFTDGTVPVRREERK